MIHSTSELSGCCDSLSVIETELICDLLFADALEIVLSFCSAGWFLMLCCIKVGAVLAVM